MKGLVTDSRPHNDASVDASPRPQPAFAAPTDFAPTESCQQSGSAKRQPPIHSLTGIRVALILWVVLFHLKPEISALLPFNPLVHFAGAGFLGVDFFFILSGFVIAYNYAERLSPFSFKNYCRFLVLRLARLYPVHLFTLLIVLLLYGAALGVGSNLSNPEYYSVSSLFQNLFLVQAWALPTIFSWNAIAWAVSCEWLAYLVFPLLLMGTTRIRSASLNWLLIVVSLLGMVSVCLGIQSSVSAPPGAGSFGLARVAVEFPVGCLLYNLYASGWGKRWRWAVITPVSWAAVVVASTVLTGHFMASSSAQEDNVFQLYLLGLTPLFAFAIYALAQQRGWFAKLFSARWVGAIAHTSYSIYLTHCIYLIMMRLAITE